MSALIHEERIIKNSRILNFPDSPIGITSPMNKYLNYLYLLGDPHLGRKFLNGVPLERRGEREREQREWFHSEVVPIKLGRDFHVTMGDLFDSFVVDNDVVEFAYRTYKEASWRNPSVQYIILAGNHDLSKDKTKVSSFQIFAELCRDLPNVKVVWQTICQRKVDDLHFLFVPYSPFHNSNEQIRREVPRFMDNPELKYVALGHWDVQDYGRDPSETLGLIPWDYFKPDQCDGVITGHDHKRRRFIHNGVEVFVTGSMLPYAHGEDDDNAEDPWYLTLPKAEVLAKIEENPEAFKMKCLRVILEDGEEPFGGIDCRQLTFKRAGSGGSGNDVVLDVAVDDFSLKALYDQVMNEHSVSSALTKSLWEKL